MVSTPPHTSKSSSPFNNPLATVPKPPITIGIIVAFMFHNFFQFPCKVEELILVFTFSFILWSAGTEKSTILQVLFFCWLLLGLVFWSRLGDLFVSQSPNGVYECHSLGQILGYAYSICSYGQILVDILANLVVYSLILLLCNLLHSLIMWLMASSLSP